MDVILKNMSREEAKTILESYIETKMKTHSPYMFPIWDGVIVYNNKNYTFRYLIDIAYGD